MDTKRCRRRFSDAFKRRVVEETLGGADSVSVVARRHDLNTNLLFTWRRRFQEGLLDGCGETALVPIEVAAVDRQAVSEQREVYGAELELVLAHGRRLTVRGLTDPVLLRAALEVLVR